MSMKQLWGNACWYLFHTLAFKLKKEHDNLIPQILTKIIYISKNLPCPDCAEHASNTLSNLRFNLVTSREGLITVLLQFHNSVNRRTDKPDFTREEYDTKYNLANLDAIVIHFIKVMNMRFPTNEQGVANELQRRIMVKDVADFIGRHRDSFN